MQQREVVPEEKRRWSGLEEWLDLPADDLQYWMPMRRNIKFGDWDREFTSETEINWFDEGKDILAGRVNSKFHCYQNRLQDEVNQWVGRREDLLSRDPETRFKIVTRKIILAQNVMLPKVLNTFL